ncbi:uncharacterized protein yc1106_02270 [Curvularia clavata]|uniref:P-loop containing nucleoside triphosphate hydrolase protein n=1 Tax=Curvularia clavata TaxID=95742 RepID=A0A9Q8Z2I4_CURCL|nr:uncharacterized protein yc1106_02270 [Curvularia clavata]
MGHKRSNRSGHAGDRSSRSRSGNQAASGNAYAALSDIQGEEAEMNSHLTERFRSSRALAGNSSLPNENIPISSSSRNNDIREYFKSHTKPITGGVWLEQPEIPDPSEVLRGKHSVTDSPLLIDMDEHIRPLKVNGAYEDKQDYLSTVYELLREDTVRPLREAIDEVRVDPYKDEAEYQNQSIGIYDPVYIKSLVFSFRGIATRVAFSLGRVKKHIRWAQSKRLITGSLVALSPTDDAFQTQCVLAIVAARPVTGLDQNPPEIDLFFARPKDQEIDPTRKWIMVECRSGFFEASRHTLSALQHMMREPFPLSNYLVHVQREVEPPAYFQRNPYADLSSLVSMEECANYENVNVLENWPNTSSLSLDESQNRALKRILTTELAIVQGPPGTGKTFVSVKALQIARDNLRKDDAPIIVTAQTNHALDQLLRHTSQFEPNYIRLGGRSKDDEIKKRTLYEVRSAAPQPKQPGGLKAQATNQLRKVTAECQTLLAPIEADKGVLDHMLLLKFGLITQAQADSLDLDSQSLIGAPSSGTPGFLIENWLGKYLVPCDRPTLPEQFDWGYEEEDFEVEQLKELEAEAVAQDDDDFETLRGPVTALSDNYKGIGASLSSTEIEDILRKTDELHKIPALHRGAIYNHFKRQVKKVMTSEVRKFAKVYHDIVIQRKIGLWEEHARTLREARIIGCTTTGLAKYRALLCSLRPRMCIVEEAAETLEAPVTTACFPSLEHLVLVGDHQQLRPHTQIRAFEDEPYYLNLSLFERLVNNNVAFDTLTRQRRMIPEIRRLLRPIYQDTLKDHHSVECASNRPPVEGMGGTNSFFFCHEWQETRDANMSAVNTKEADMVVHFFDYLVLNGVDPTKITILTFYNGQRKQILRAINAHPNLRIYRGIQVVTVDSFQGEENDIVLLSLVRSNKNHSVGFLSSENRACVALSRAKRGFYLFGNAELLACESETWADVVETMFKNKKPKVTAGQERRVGYQLPLQCSKHGRKMWCEEPADFDLIKGGCDLRCDGALPCGHRCPYTCHPFEHDRINCTQRCTRRVEICGHPCVAICCDPCKCQMCDRRTDGIKSTLKLAPKGATSISERTLSLGSAFHSPRHTERVMTMATMPSRTPPSFQMAHWKAYATGGGVQQDDINAFHKMKKEEARCLEKMRASTSEAGSSSASGQLISVSPEEVTTEPTDADLLIDLGSETQLPRVQHQPKRSYASAAARSQKPHSMNLLD